jgi:hypothetical protein
MMHRGEFHEHFIKLLVPQYDGDLGRLGCQPFSLEQLLDVFFALRCRSVAKDRQDLSQLVVFAVWHGD